MEDFRIPDLTEWTVAVVAGQFLVLYDPATDTTYRANINKLFNSHAQNTDKGTSSTSFEIAYQTTNDAASGATVLVLGGKNGGKKAALRYNWDTSTTPATYKIQQTVDYTGTNTDVWADVGAGNADGPAHVIKDVSGSGDPVTMAQRPNLELGAGFTITDNSATFGTRVVISEDFIRGIKATGLADQPAAPTHSPILATDSDLTIKEKIRNSLAYLNSAKRDAEKGLIKNSALAENLVITFDTPKDFDITATAANLSISLAAGADLAATLALHKRGVIIDGWFRSGSYPVNFANTAGVTFQPTEKSEPWELVNGVLNDDHHISFQLWKDTDNAGTPTAIVVLYEIWQ